MSETHVVMFSGGLGSWMTAKKVAEKHGTENLILLFADVKGNSTSPHVGEDEDTYRFIEEAAANVGGTLVTVMDGRDIWQVFKDDRFLGNSRLANCSKILKQRPSRAWLEANCDPETTTVYVGIDWTETHRMAGIIRGYLPWKAEAPLTEAPFITKEEIIEACEAEGLEIPRLYKAGFPHNNCGGFCVRAGQAQFELLLNQNPERYAFHEEKEQEIREHLDKDVAILTSRKNKQRVPLTLKRFREDLQQTPDDFDEFDFGGCGCFLDPDQEQAA